RFLGAQQGMGERQVLVYAQHQRDHVLLHPAVESGGNELSHYARVVYGDVVGRVLDVGHFSTEHGIGRCGILACGKAEDIDDRVDDFTGYAASLFATLDPARQVRPTNQRQVVRGVENRCVVVGLQVRQRVVGIAQQATPADTAGDVVAVTFIVVVVVGVDIAEIDAGIRLAGPAPAVDVDFSTTDVPLRIQPRTDEHLDAAVVLRHVDV